MKSTNLLAYLLAIKVEVVVLFIASWYGYNYVEKNYPEPFYLKYSVIVLAVLAIFNLYYKFFKVLIKNYNKNDS